MSDFSILFKYEMDAMFPFRKKKGNFDILGTLISILITLVIAAVVVFLLTTILDSYVTIKVDKISDPVGRSLELLNVLYVIVIVALAGMCLEKMRSTLTNPADREIFLRLPVKQETIFLSKLVTLMIANHISALFMIVPINVIFYIVLKPDFTFWLLTLGTWVLMPFVSFLIAAVLIVPYIKVVDFIKDRYGLLFLVLSALLVGAFLLYAQLLGIVQSLFETGTIKFLFNAEFISFLQGLTLWTYPAVSFANMMLGLDVIISLAIGLGVAVLSVLATYFITKKLYYITLYKNRDRARKNKEARKPWRKAQISSLINKEFINVFRDPKHMFSYFAISAAMPIMVYSCYTLFETLILNALGIRVPFSLALITILLFNILTNTFCSTNITRDGESNLKIKVMPLKASKILFAKVIFCDIVSTLSVVISVMLIHITSKNLAAQNPGVAYLTLNDALICAAVVLVFAFAQILVATRLDLNGAKITATHQEIEKSSNRTIALTVSIGLVLCVLVGMSSMLISLYAGGKSVADIFGVVVSSSLAYYIPVGIAAAYLLFALFFYSFRLEKKFEALVR